MSRQSGNRESMRGRLPGIIGIFVMLVLASGSADGAPENSAINISLNSTKVHRGETVEASLQATTGGLPSSDTVYAVLLQPSRGTATLPLQKVAGSPGKYRIEIPLGADFPEGMYAIHAWTGQSTSPLAVGKATFLLGQIVADFFIASYLDEAEPVKDLDDYLWSFRQVGGNFLIAHNLITPTKIYYPSKICKTNVTPGLAGDVVELVLSRADKYGYTVLLSVSWDMTRQSPYKQRKGSAWSL